MERKFEVDEVSFNEFNTSCGVTGVRPEVNEYIDRKRKRFFRFEDRVEKDIEGLLSNAADVKQELKCVWLKDGNMAIGEARRRTMGKRKEHLDWVTEHSKECFHLIVQTAKLKFLNSRHKSDSFDFYKGDNGLWLMKYWHVDKANFRDYDLSKAGQITLGTPSIAGIYSGNGCKPHY